MKHSNFKTIDEKNIDSSLPIIDLINAKYYETGLVEIVDEKTKKVKKYLRLYKKVNIFCDFQLKMILKNLNADELVNINGEYWNKKDVFELWSDAILEKIDEFTFDHNGRAYEFERFYEIINDHYCSISKEELQNLIFSKFEFIRTGRKYKRNALFLTANYKIYNCCFWVKL